MAESNTELLRNTTLQHLWMHNSDWSQMAEDGRPMLVVDGKGIRVTDSEGNTWIDVNGGYMSVSVGYGRTEIAKAAYEQMCKMPYFPMGTTTPPTALLAKKLADISPGSLSRVFPSSGGSEANETALKIARAYHHRRGDSGRYKVISRKGSYHGGTGGVLWLGSNPTISRVDYEPIPPGIVYAPQPNTYRCEMGGKSSSECAIRCAQAIEDLILQHNPDTVAAVIAEPISTPEGVCVPGDEYWPMIRDICDRYGVLLIADEVICGFGRTGKMFAIEHWNIVPDILTVAKGIVSSYIPMGATIVRSEIADHFTGEGNYLRHVFTSSGNPAASAAALKNIEIIESEDLVNNSANMGAYLKEQLESLMADHQIVGDVRGIGLLTTLEFVSDRETKSRFPADVRFSDRLAEKLKSHRLIWLPGLDVLNFAPPLCITSDEIDEIIHALDLSLWELEGELGMAKMV